MSNILNSFQIAVSKEYASGDFSHISEVKSASEFEAFLDDCGDGLFVFLMNELATSEDCDTQETALNRLRNAMADIATAIDQVESL